MFTVPVQQILTVSVHPIQFVVEPEQMPQTSSWFMDLPAIAFVEQKIVFVMNPNGHAAIFTALDFHLGLVNSLKQWFRNLPAAGAFGDYLQLPGEKNWRFPELAPAVHEVGLGRKNLFGPLARIVPPPKTAPGSLLVI